MPLEDRVTCELISLLPDGMPVGVVDRSPGSEAEWWSVVSHINTIGRAHEVLGSGPGSVCDYAANRMRTAVEELRTSVSEPLRGFEDEPLGDHCEVALVARVDRELVHQLLIEKSDGSVGLRPMERSQSRHGNTSFREGFAGEWADVERPLSSGVLRRMISEGERVTFVHPETGIACAVIGLRPGRVGEISFVEALWAPQ
jgi:hypothetical protein